MRKLLLLFLVLCFSASSVFAQQSDHTDEEGRLLSKRGQVILPSAGDVALGIDARSLLNIFDFGGAQPSANLINQQIFLKYFVSDNMAFRVRVGVDQSIDTERNRVILDNQSMPDPSVEVTDEWTNSVTDLDIGAGLELRRGKGRVVGVFGGEVAFLYSKTHNEYSYGNPMTLDNQAPTTTANFGTSFSTPLAERIVDETQSKQLGVGLNGFAGVEYFIAPQMSLGAEFTLGFDLIKDHKGEATYEFWDATSGSKQTRSEVTAGGSEFSLGTGNYGGTISLNLYF